MLIAAAVVAADQITKHVVDSTMALGERITVIPGVLHFTYVRNSGAAFGGLANHRWIFMVLSIVMIALISGYIAFSRTATGPVIVTLAMILGGGVGNMIDRFAYGYVIDFIDVRLLPSVWKWVFNVADCFVTVGAVLLFIFFIAAEKKRRKEEANKAHDAVEAASIIEDENKDDVNDD